MTTATREPTHRPIWLSAEESGVSTTQENAAASRRQLIDDRSTQARTDNSTADNISLATLKGVEFLTIASPGGLEDDAVPALP